jgi:hypothetical protein
MSLTYCLPGNLIFPATALVLSLPISRGHKTALRKVGPDLTYTVRDDKEHEMQDLTEECVSRRNVNYEHLLLNSTFMLLFW